MSKRTGKWPATEFDFVEPDRKKEYRKVKIMITPEDITTVTQQIVSVWEKIQNREFYTGCGKPDCHWCNFVKNNNLAVALHETGLSGGGDLVCLQHEAPRRAIAFLFFVAPFRRRCHAHGLRQYNPPYRRAEGYASPRIIDRYPVEFSKHITGNKIVFKFDEYIDAKDIRTELVVNPVPKIEPITDGHLQTVTVKLKDTLQPNTTYTLNFYKGIKDVNEGNILRNFTYVFSTGDHIDSGQFAGNVLVALTGKPDSSLVVILQKKLDDSAVFKERPRYLTKVDSTGRFVFDHIEPGRYAVYALQDEGGSHKYLSKAQLFAFADAPVDVSWLPRR